MNRSRRTASVPADAPRPPAPLAEDDEFEEALASEPTADLSLLDDGNEPPPSAVETRSANVSTALHLQRLDRFLVSFVPEFSRGHLQHLIERGQVAVDGRVADSASRRVKAGQVVAVTLLPTAESSAFQPEAMALPIVYEDEHLLVLDKPAGLVVHPAAGHWSGTLLNGLLAHHPGARHLPRAGIVHRLDKDTSGLMVVAKNLEAQTALVRMIAAHEVRREYLALVWGAVQPKPFSVEAPIGRDPVSRVRMAVVPGGKAARTDVCRLLAATVPPVFAGAPEPAAGRSASLVLCRLHTGRTHQIRVHLVSKGHPLVADAVYGGKAALGMARQALHATQLSFAHPIDARACRFRAELPADLDLALKVLAGPGGHETTIEAVDKALHRNDGLEETKSA